MNNPVFGRSKLGLLQPLADLELPITVNEKIGQSVHPECNTNLSNFGAVSEFLSVPFKDDEVSAAEYADLNADDKRKRDMIAGHWLSGRALYSERPNTSFYQSYFLFDVVDWQRDEFEELIQNFLIPGGIAVIVHSLRGHTANKPKARMIFPLFEPIPLADAYLAQPELPELLCHLEMSGRVVGECLSEVDRQFELPSISRDEEYLFYAVDGAPIFADSILDMLNDGCLHP